MNNYENFGEYLCQQREKKGLSQLELSKLMDVSQAAIGQWERNTFIPKNPKLNKLAEVLEVPIEELKREVVIAKKNLSKHKLLSKENKKPSNNSMVSATTDLSSMFLLSKLANALGNNLLNPQQISMIGSLIKTFQHDNNK